MKDGLYRVHHYGVCAGFVIKRNTLVACAPILRKRLAFWMNYATWISP